MPDDLIVCFITEAHDDAPRLRGSRKVARDICVPGGGPRRRPKNKTQQVELKLSTKAVTSPLAFTVM
jgi:hypothetical protein